MLTTPDQAIHAITPVGRPQSEFSASGDALALALMRAVVQPVILMDLDGRVTLLNPAAQTMLVAQDWRSGQSRYWWQMWPHADSAALRGAVAEAASGDTVTIKLDCRRAVASTATLCPIDDSDGEIAKVLCVLRAA